MSKYTTELRFICESKAGLNESVGYNEVENVIANSRDKIFNFNYPIFDESYRSVLETKIIKHYYTREICAETFGLWQLWLNSRMNEIMPYYNKLYESELLTFDPLKDYFLEKSGSKEGTGNETNSGTDEVNRTTSGSDRVSGTLGGSDIVSGTLGGSDRVSGTLGGSDRIVSQDSGTDSETNSTTGSGTASKEYGGTDSTHIEDVPVKDTWDLYSDTPQGDVIGMNNDNNKYLTNARHITESGAGSERDDLKTYGQTVDDSSSYNESGSKSITHGKKNEETTTYGKTNSETTTYGKTNEETTTYGKTNNETTTYGKVNDESYDYGKIIDSTSTEEYFETLSGKISGVSYSKLLEEYRDTFLNIDVLIINNLSDLFFNLW